MSITVKAEQTYINYKIKAEQSNQIINILASQISKPVTVKVQTSGLQGIQGNSAYQVALANGFVGTESQWLASLQGSDGDTPVKGIDYFDGDDGREVEIQNNGTHIQWRLVGGVSWNNIVPLIALKGADGITPIKGIDYFDGDDGREVEIQNNGTHIQWRLVGDVSWNNIVTLIALKGADGITPIKGIDYFDGDDGREVELDNNGTYIRWRLAGEAIWNNIIPLTALKGDSGVVDYSIALINALVFG